MHYIVKTITLYTTASSVLLDISRCVTLDVCYICQMLDPFGSADNSLSSSCQSIDQALDRWVKVHRVGFEFLIADDNHLQIYEAYYDVYFTLTCTQRSNRRIKLVCLTTSGMIAWKTTTKEIGSFSGCHGKGTLIWMPRFLCYHESERKQRPSRRSDGNMSAERRSRKWEVWSGVS